MPAFTLFDSCCRRLALLLVRCVPALLVLCAPTTVLAQDVTEVGLKSAFIYNFVKFTQWPADALPAGAGITACVVGDPAVGEALVRTVTGRQLDGRGITVSIIPPGTLLPTCHVLYVSGSGDKRAVEIMMALRVTPVLTISDLAEFARRGGMVQLFAEAGKMRFSVNLRATKRARLQLSSRLLALAELVEEQP